MKLLQLARFAAGAGGAQMPGQAFGGYGDDVIVPCAIEINGVEMRSKSPRSAAQAEFINRAVQQAITAQGNDGPG